MCDFLTQFDSATFPIASIALPLSLHRFCLSSHPYSSLLSLSSLRLLLQFLYIQRRMVTECLRGPTKDVGNLQAEPSLL